MKKIFIMAGEVSGDLRGSELAKELKCLEPSLDLYGIGGSYMEEQGVKLFRTIDDLSVVGFTEVLLKIRFFRKLFNEVFNYLCKIKPDLLILIDYPGFNLKLAEKVYKETDIKIVYYISPQIWAWHKSRIHRIIEFSKKIVVIFKFEEELYSQYTDKAVFIGHPLIDRIDKKWYYENEKDKKDIITLLPGSRIQEIQRILPEMLKVTETLINSNPDLKIFIPNNNKKLIETIEQTVYSSIKKTEEEILRNYGIISGEPYSFISDSKLVLTCSGTATLETGIIAAPMIIMYKVSYITGLIGKILIKVPFLGLVNIVAGREVVPEFLQENMKAELILEEAESILNDKSKRDKMHDDLIKVRKLLGDPGAAVRGAEEVLKVI